MKKIAELYKNFSKYPNINEVELYLENTKLYKNLLNYKYLHKAISSI